MSDHAAPVLSLRADLIRRRIEMGGRFVWVLKDPLSRAFFYFSDREFSILKLLNGRRQTPEIIKACRVRLAPDFVSAESVVTFLADAKRNGLITSSAGPIGDGETGGPSGQRQASQLGRSRWKNLLAIRFPGANPDRLLDFVTPKVRPLFSPLTFAAALLLGAFAVISVIANFDQFTSHVGIAATRTSGSWLITVIVVISLTKIIHELAHAVACKAYGAECREIGVMLLVGIPCLYCDVSDAWMLGQRFKRIVVSAAGMFAELLIATVAAFLWLFSTDGMVRDVCVTTMIICSISTVIFNGNPLLRYDGYFILSDLLGIPNLAAESSRLIRGTLRRKLWGLPAISNRSTQSEPNRNGVLASYGVLSGAYRLLVLALICLILYRFAETMGVGLLGGGLAVLILASAIWQSVYSIVKPPGVIESRWANPARRPALLAGIGGGLILLALFYPLPRSVLAPAVIDAAESVDLFVETPGQLVWALPAGNQVNKGDTVARFRNYEMEQEILSLDTRRKTLRTELASLQQRRSLDTQAAGKIESVSKALEAADNDYLERRAEAERLLIRAPRSGRVFAPRNQYQPTPEADAIQTWHGTPLDAKNIGSFFAQGTLLCSVGDVTQREAIVLVRQQDIALLRRGQAVQLLRATDPAGHHAGAVIEVATSPIIQAAREFFAAGLVDPSASATSPGATRNTYYQVRVRLNDSQHPLRIRSTARAKIRVERASLASRLFRSANDTFRFQP